MKQTDKHQRINKVTFAGFLVTLGIVFGDIGTSPLYAMSAIVGTRTIEIEHVPIVIAEPKDMKLTREM